ERLFHEQREAVKETQEQNDEHCDRQPFMPRDMKLCQGKISDNDSDKRRSEVQQSYHPQQQYHEDIGYALGPAHRWFKLSGCIPVTTNLLHSSFFTIGSDCARPGPPSGHFWYCPCCVLKVVAGRRGKCPNSRDWRHRDIIWATT